MEAGAKQPKLLHIAEENTNGFKKISYLSIIFVDMKMPSFSNAAISTLE